jgi:hypothetical protein
MIFGLFVRKIRKIGGQNSRKRARMVLQNVNNQLFSPFLRLKPAKLPDMTAKNEPESFCKTLKNNDCLLFRA